MNYGPRPMSLFLSYFKLSTRLLNGTYSYFVIYVSFFDLVVDFWDSWSCHCVLNLLFYGLLEKNIGDCFRILLLFRKAFIYAMKMCHTTQHLTSSCIYERFMWTFLYNVTSLYTFFKNYFHLY